MSGSNKPVRNNASHCVFPTGLCRSGRCLEVLFPGLHAPGFHCPRLTLAALPRYLSSSSHLPVFKKYGPILTWWGSDCQRGKLHKIPGLFSRGPWTFAKFTEVLQILLAQTAALRYSGFEPSPEACPAEGFLPAKFYTNLTESAADFFRNRRMLTVGKIGKGRRR